MRQSVRLAAAAIAVAALTVGVAAPAGAQESLGFETNITEGGPGEIVAGQVDTDDVTEHCTTDIEEFRARWLEVFQLFADMEGGLFERFYEGDEFVFENHDQLAYSATGIVTLGLSNVFNTPEVSEEALPQTFVMTFADIATQEPVGERSTFDPDTGEGSVVVPDIEPGLWAVAAACVGATLDLDFLEAGIRANGDFLEEIGAPLDPNTEEFVEFIQEFLDDEDATSFIDDFLPAVGPQLIENIVKIDAFGAQIFCILDAEGVCPADEVPEELPDDLEAPEPARPVLVQPAFTG